MFHLPSRLLIVSMVVKYAALLDVLKGSDISFTCDLSDLPIVWRFKSNITGEYRTVAYLNAVGRIYTDDYSTHRLEKRGMGTRLTILNVEIANGGVYACKTFYNQTIKQEFSLNVVKPPSGLRIEQKYTAEIGELYTLACIADDVKPAPRIRWQLEKPDGEKVNMTSKSVYSVTQFYNTSNKAVSVVGVTLTREVQGSLLVCYVDLETKQLGVIYRESVEAHTTNALFKPLTPVLYGLDENLIANKIYTLRCIAGYANPPATITWYKDGVTWSASKADIRPFIGYFITTSYLEINATHVVDNSTFTCNVTNSLMLRDKDPPFLINTTCHVDYAPIIGVWVHNKTVDEGDAVELDCAVKHSKPVATIRWLRNDEPVDLTSPRFSVYPYPDTKWTSLSIPSASWQDVGEWRCEAYNTIGIVTSQPIYVNVKHKPYCSKNVTIVKSSLGGTAALSCSVHSSPTNDVKVNWTSANKLIASNQIAQKVADKEGVVFQTIYVETRFLSDYGSFFCSATNKYGQTPWKCEVQLVHQEIEPTVAAPVSAFLAAFGGGTQSYVVISCIGVVLVMLILLVVVMALVKRRNNRNKDNNSIEEEANTPNVYYVKSPNPSTVSSTNGSTSNRLQTMAGARDCVSIENLNDLILHQTDYMDAYDRSRLEIVEMEENEDSNPTTTHMEKL